MKYQILCKVAIQNPLFIELNVIKQLCVLYATECLFSPFLGLLKVILADHLILNLSSIIWHLYAFTGPSLSLSLEQNFLLILIYLFFFVLDRYSVDQGKCWNELKFADENQPMVIRGLVTEPNSTSRSFSLWGYDKSATKEWKVVTINFHKMFSRICKFHENALFHCPKISNYWSNRFFIYLFLDD